MQNRPLGGDIRKGRPQTRIIPPPYKWDPSELGIAKFTCYKCGQPTKFCKGWKDPECPYANSPACRTRCRATPCSGGCHQSSQCLGIIHNAVAALKKEKQAENSKQAHLVQETNEGNQFFEDIEEQDEDFFDLNI